MTLSYTLKRNDRIKIFLLQYYTLPFWKYVRIFAGPVLVLMGIFLLNVPGKLYIAYGGFCIGYGCYYILKPYLAVLIRFRKSIDENIELKILEDNKLEINDKNASSSIDFSMIKSVKLSRKYLIINLASPKYFTLFVPVASVTDGNVEGVYNGLVQKVK